MTIFGLAGLGVAAFTPSALSMVGDAAPPGQAGRAFAWYSTAHYGAIGIGPFLGGLAADWWEYRGAFVASAIGIGLALVIGSALPARSSSRAPGRPGATFADVRRNVVIWAGWILSVSGLLIQGVGASTIQRTPCVSTLSACMRSGSSSRARRRSSPRVPTSGS